MPWRWASIRARSATRRVRGKYAERYAQGTNIVLLDPDVAEVFPEPVSLPRRRPTD
jgi:hypothetical protein